MMQSEKTQCSSKEDQSLFDVYLRLRPSQSQNTERRNPFLAIIEAPNTTPETEDSDSTPPDGTTTSPTTHITVQPPSEPRKKAIERFTFTKVFDEDATQLNVFQETGVPRIINEVLNAGRDGLIAALGVTGSGKSHTILGSSSQRGIVQLSLDVLYTSLAATICGVDDEELTPVTVKEISEADPSEAQISPARTFLEGIYLDPYGGKSRYARPSTPGDTLGNFETSSTASSSDDVRNPTPFHRGYLPLAPEELGQMTADHGKDDRGKGGCSASTTTPSTIRLVAPKKIATPGPNGSDRQTAVKRRHWQSAMPVAKSSPSRSQPPHFKESAHNTTKRCPFMTPSLLPNVPDMSGLTLSNVQGDQHVILISMWEIYNDRIYDLLASINDSIHAPSTGRTKAARRKPLSFKHTESSPDSKVVSGLLKIVCGSYDEALMVIQAGLVERKVSDTETNHASSRSHGFFCIEVKRKEIARRGDAPTWVGNSLTIVDLAGSERARNAKTKGATLAEAGKINESLMYLGQCLQMQSEPGEDKKAAVPYRQCKLTELLFTNSFAHASSNTSRRPQRGLIIVTADRWHGDFNATSQILRYAALAKKVAIPRRPLFKAPASISSTRPSSSSAIYPSPTLIRYAQELESAEKELCRLNEAYQALALRLTEEEDARAGAEFRWKAAEERCLLIEQEVREECWEEMEQKLSVEIDRWKQAWQNQARRHDEHLDKKLDLLSRGIRIHEDSRPGLEDEAEELRRENETLRRRITKLERQIYCQSPTLSPSKFQNKGQPTTQTKHASKLLDGEDLENVNPELDLMTLNPVAGHSRTRNASQSAKKRRGLTARQRDLMPEDILNEFQ